MEPLQLYSSNTPCFRALILQNEIRKYSWILTMPTSGGKGLTRRSVQLQRSGTLSAFRQVVGLANFPHILKTARMTSLTSPTPFQLTLTTHNLIQAVEWSNQKSVGPGLHVYGLDTPLVIGTLFWTAVISRPDRHSVSQLIVRGERLGNKFPISCESTSLSQGLS